MTRSPIGCPCLNRRKAEIERLEYHLDCECSAAADVGTMLIGEENAKTEGAKEFAKYLLDNYASGGVISAVDVVDAVVNWGTSSG